MRRSLLAAALALPLSSCCTDPVDGSSYFCLGDMSVAEEQALGDQYAPSIAAEFGGPYHDPAAFEYLNGLIMEMAKHSIRAEDFDWRFTILNTSVPNAFAVPGGYIYITRGLLAALETEGQFISVMGHELGHVEHRHSHKAMGKQVLGSVVVGAVSEAESAFAPAGTGELGVAASAAALGTQLVLLKYDRGQESEADERGIYYAYGMGYDPMEGKKTFEYFQKLEDEQGGAPPMSWLRTHPLNEDRVSDIDAKVREMHPDVVEKPKDAFRPYKQDNERFAEIVARIRKVQPTYEQYDAAIAAVNEGLQGKDPAKIQAALAKLEDAAAKIPSEPLFHAGIGLAHIGLDQAKPAVAALEKAIALDDARPTKYKLFEPRYYLGVVRLEQGDLAAAKKSLTQANEAFPQHPAPVYQLAVVAEEQKQVAEAKKLYQRVIELEGNPEGTLTKKANERLKRL